MQTTYSNSRALVAAHPVDVRVTESVAARNRLTCAFRPFLALPHVLLVGAPAAWAVSVGWPSEGKPRLEWGTTGVLGAVAAVVALIAWFAMVFGERYPEGLRNLATLYLRWRVRAIAYMALLRDEYPPFGDGPYAAMLSIEPSPVVRNRWSIAFRLILVVPQLFMVTVLGMAWAIATFIAWLSILFTGNFPPALYNFNVGMLRWTTRVEAYVLLLHDVYPPFSLE
jgi:hypothetical protein